MNKHEIERMARAWQEVTENRFVIPEEIPANERTAFHGAAAAAAKAGKKSFSFAGKTHPVTMKKDTATKIADQKENMDDDKEERMHSTDKTKNAPVKKKAGDTATMNPKMETDKKATNESVDHHNHMANAHYQHATAHESEVTNGGHDDHDYAGNAHDDAHKAHKAAAAAHKKHGGDSAQYKSAAAKAKSATDDAKEQSKDAGRFKKVAKPKISLGGSSTKKPPSGSPASRGVKAPGYTKMKMTNKGLQKESRIRKALLDVLENKEMKKHSPNMDKAETMDDKLKGDGAKQMKKDLEGPTVDIEKQSHDDAAKAGRAGPNMKARPNDNMKGDKKVVNPVAGVVTKEK